MSSFCGAAASLNAEYIARCEPVGNYYPYGRKDSCTGRESIRSFAAHKSTMVLFLSSGLTEELSKELIEGGYEKILLLRLFTKLPGRMKKYSDAPLKVSIKP